MPHDKNGKELISGDRVKVEFEVEHIGQDDGYCNVQLITVEGLPGNGFRAVLAALNSRQCEKVEGDK